MTMYAVVERKAAVEEKEIANCKLKIANCKLGDPTRDRSSALAFSTPARRDEDVFHFQFSIRFLSSSYRRGGVTLLEVLFSMGIVSVGLLGTILLLPLAAHQAKEGVRADISARVGKNAFNEVAITSVDNPANWLFANATPVKSLGQPGPYFIPEGAAFCIDARFIAYHSLVAATPISPGLHYELFPYVYNPANVATAPAFPPSFPLGNYKTAFPPSPAPQPNVTEMPFMNRISLRTELTSNALMGLLQADDRFVSQHDLLFEKSDDETLPPLQIDIKPTQPRNWGSSPPYSTPVLQFPDRLKRDSDGKFSWMLTVTPKADVTMQSRDLYTMSLIVFHDRNSSFLIDNLTERIAQVTRFDGQGVGGGEVTLTFADPTGLYDADTVRVRADDWIMLASQLRTPPPPGTALTTLPVFRWYRVVSTATPLYDIPTSTWVQDVTLHGPDWDRPEWIGGAAPPAVTTYAVVVNNVSAVYEKTLRLESSSLWTNR